ncbi:MAG: DUF3795 domain-containing protein [Spirochaetes bacterium]|nr:DUF3795 domain-containing protein [Spirochaetota bacterium]
MKTIEKNVSLVAFCGLFCGSCRAYLKGRCKGCSENTKASWCNIRKCCIENCIKSCAECTKNGIENCKDFRNPIAKIIEFFTGTSRAKCIDLIKKMDYEEFGEYMNKNKLVSVKK